MLDAAYVTLTVTVTVTVSVSVAGDPRLSVYEARNLLVVRVTGQVKQHFGLIFLSLLKFCVGTKSGAWQWSTRTFLFIW